MIREQDLHLALLRSSLGTTAQHDPSLSHLRFQLPSGPLRPLLPSLAHTGPMRDLSTSLAAAGHEPTAFDDLLLGTPLVLNYSVSWPLDLFLHTSDLHIYATLFAVDARRRSDIGSAKVAEGKRKQHQPPVSHNASRKQRLLTLLPPPAVLPLKAVLDPSVVVLPPPSE